MGMKWGLDTDLPELGEDLKYCDKLLMGSQGGPGYTFRAGPGAFQVPSES